MDLEMPNNCGMIGLESIIIGFAPRSSVENVILCVCWQLGNTVETEQVHTHTHRLDKYSYTVAPSNSPTPPTSCSFFFVRLSETLIDIV